MSGVGSTMTRSDADPATRSRFTAFTGLLPQRLVRWRRPIWWHELVLTAIGYWLYSLARNAIPGQESIAERHGRTIQHVQDVLHLNWELSFNHFVAAREWLAQIFNYYYATMHFIMIIAVLVWLYLRRPQIYRGARTVLYATTLFGLAGFALYPLAPPRLLPQYGYIDTIVKFHTWGSWADSNVAAHSNQYAAMPSLHIGWSLFCGITIWRCARRPWVRAAGMLHPLVTLLVITGTANHFILDAVGGALVLAGGFAVQALFSGHGAFTPAVDAPVQSARSSPPPRAKRRVGQAPS